MQRESLIKRLEPIETLLSQKLGILKEQHRIKKIEQEKAGKNKKKQLIWSSSRSQSNTQVSLDLEVRQMQSGIDAAEKVESFITEAKVLFGMSKGKLSKSIEEIETQLYIENPP